MTATCQRAVVIGASAGALESLTPILTALPQDFPCALLIVVHLPPDRDSVLAKILQSKCRLDVREAEDKEPLLPGRVYVAPPDYHMLVELNKHISLSSEEPVHFSRPAIDLTFSSAADAFGSALTGVILSGANDDGAAGLRDVERAGGRVLVQQPSLAVAREMPEAALRACHHAAALTLQEIAQRLCETPDE
jgi:two-component system chemotaxis response regulator CheB